MGIEMSVGGKERNAWTAAGGGRGGDDCGCWENCDLNFRLISLGDAAQRAVPVLPIRVKFAAHNFGIMDLFVKILRVLHSSEVKAV